MQDDEVDSLEPHRFWRPLRWGFWGGVFGAIYLVLEMWKITYNLRFAFSVLLLVEKIFGGG